MRMQETENVNVNALENKQKTKMTKQNWIGPEQKTKTKEKWANNVENMNTTTRNEVLNE